MHLTPKKKIKKLSCPEDESLRQICRLSGKRSNFCSYKIMQIFCANKYIKYKDAKILTKYKYRFCEIEYVEEKPQKVDFDKALAIAPKQENWVSCIINKRIKQEVERTKDAVIVNADVKGLGNIVWKSNHGLHVQQVRL